MPKKDNSQPDVIADAPTGLPPSMRPGLSMKPPESVRLKSGYVVVQIPEDLALRIDLNQEGSPYQYLSRDDYVTVILGSQVPQAPAAERDDVVSEPPEAHIAGDPRTGTACYCNIGHDHP